MTQTGSTNSFGPGFAGAKGWGAGFATGRVSADCIEEAVPADVTALDPLGWDNMQRRWKKLSLYADRFASAESYTCASIHVLRTKERTMILAIFCEAAVAVGICDQGVHVAE